MSPNWPSHISTSPINLVVSWTSPRPSTLLNLYIKYYILSEKKKIRLHQAHVNLYRAGTTNF